MPELSLVNILPNPSSIHINSNPFFVTVDLKLPGLIYSPNRLEGIDITPNPLAFTLFNVLEAVSVFDK